MNTIGIRFTEEQLERIVQVFETGRANAAEHAENDQTLAQIMTDYDTLHAIFDSARKVLVLRARARTLAQIVEELNLEDNSDIVMTERTE